MALSSTTLSAIQHAGAAVFSADAELKNAVKDYAERVHAAMAANPYGLGNDTLFENWKRVARLAQTMAGIEEELRKVYQLAAEVMADDEPPARQVPVLAAPLPAAAAAVAGRDDLTPTDVWVKTQTQTKTKTKKAKPGAGAAKAKPRARLLTPAGTADVRRPLGANPTKLLRHLAQVLNANEFTEISQTACARATGIPLGSMSAAIKKLTETGRLMAGPAGRLRLAD